MQGAALRKDATETFRFQVSMAPPESELVAWLESDVREVVYCRGFVLLRDAPAVKLVQAWHREGLLTFKQHKTGGETLWIAEKRGVAARASSSAAVGRKNTEHLVQVQLRALLELLREAAAAGRRCPTKTDMAKAVTGQTSQRARNRVTYLRKRLEAEGKIAVAAGTHAQAPVVTILARGKGCGLSTAADNSTGES